MTISNDLLPAHVGGLIQSETHSAQQRLSAAEAMANQLDLPDWSRMSDAIYRYGYIVALRIQALQWRIQATQRAALETCYYSEATRTLFVQIYFPGQLSGVHLRGKIRHQQSYAAIDIRGSCTSLRVGECLSTLGEQWASWQLLSLEVAEEEGF